MDLQLAGKRAIVTGASRGIGFAVAKVLAAEEVHVALVARSQQALDIASAELTATGAKASARVCDTTDDEAVRAMVAQVALDLGGIDILVNAAAQPSIPGASRPLQELEDADLRVEIDTKVLGYLRCAKAVAPHMTSQGWGRIINVSGLAARQTGSVFGSIRNVAVAAMTKNLADELGPSGINVTVVHPGMTATERTPGLIAEMAANRGSSEEEVIRRIAAGISIRRFVTAAEIADVVAFLASPRSVSINGEAVAVGGGVVGPIYY
ncbi:SDR family NAD(P)-dependent oxidoreductase [Jatrophihabitans sp. DSM 45814]